eukprot:6184581-Pleurochrysis_carterae.AAC.2
MYRSSARVPCRLCRSSRAVLLPAKGACTLVNSRVRPGDTKVLTQGCSLWTKSRDTPPMLALHSN